MYKAKATITLDDVAAAKLAGTDARDTAKAKLLAEAAAKGKLDDDCLIRWMGRECGAKEEVVYEMTLLVSAAPIDEYRPPQLPVPDPYRGRPVVSPPPDEGLPWIFPRPLRPRIRWSGGNTAEQQ